VGQGEQAREHPLVERPHGPGGLHGRELDPCVANRHQARGVPEPGGDVEGLGTQVARLLDVTGLGVGLGQPAQGESPVLRGKRSGAGAEAIRSLPNGYDNGTTMATQAMAPYERAVNHAALQRGA
jgi:hypothetical protein